MSRSMVVLSALAIAVPMAAVAGAWFLDRLLALNERVERRKRIVGYAVLGAVYAALGIVAISTGGRIHGVTFLIIGIFWVVYALWLRRVWRDSLDEPVGPDGPP